MTRKLLTKVLAGPLLAGAALLGGVVLDAAPASALEAGDILVRLRGIGVIPTDESDGIRTDLTTSGLEAQPTGVPELDFTYMVTDNVGLELILATSPHDLDFTGVQSGIGTGGTVWLLPPTLLVQYHFMADRSIRPYVGAGVNLTIAYGEDASQSLVTALGGPTNLKADNSIGWAVQAGVDIDLNDRWFFNLDVKYIAISVDVAITTPATSTTRYTTLDINPVIVGAGIGYRF
jgi:outer membrane protein